MGHSLTGQRGMGAVGRLEAERVLAGSKGQFRLYTPIAEVQVRLILGNGLPGGDAGRVDHDMEVARAVMELSLIHI